MDAIHVIGMGTRTPFGTGPTVLLEGLCRGQRVFDRYPPFVTAGMRHPVAAAIPDPVLDDEATAGVDRGTRMLAAAVRDALLDAAGRPDLRGLAGTPAHRVALVVGTSSGGIGPFCEALRTQVPRTTDDARYASGTELVASALGIRGPVLVVCSVCASGAVAVAEAADLVASGVADVAIAAGYDPLEPFVGAGFDAIGATADRPCPFRAGRRGLVLGEAAAALVLARGPGPRGSHGLVRGWATASDAYHVTTPHPEGLGLRLAIEGALRGAKMDPSEPLVINAHGTATVYNDAMEVRALESVFGPRAGGRAVYTVKGTIGHTLAAAGAVEAVVAFAAMQRGVIPPTATEGDPDPHCDVDLVVERRADAGADTLSLSAGFGGVNCALVLSAGSATRSS